MSLFDNLPHAVDIKGPPVSGRDADGGVTVSWNIVRQSGARCLINSSMAVSSMRFGQAQLIGPVTVAFNKDATVERGDLLVVSGGPYDGARLRVDGLNDVQGIGNIEDFLLVRCEGIK